MTKVLVVSDNHGLRQELYEIKERHQVDYMVHCGDSELDIDAQAMEGFYKVKGNCDFDHRFPEELTIEIDGVPFFIVHGHRHQVNRDLSTLSYAAEEKEAVVVCYGHTHVARTDYLNGQYIINPGSIAQSRSMSPETYAIIQWTRLEDLEVNYYTIEGKTFPALDFKKV